MILSLSPDNRHHPYTMSLCTQSKYFKQSHITLTIGILSQISPTVQTISNSLTIILLMFFSTIYSVSLCFWAFFTSLHFFVSFFCKVFVRIHTISILWISYNFSWFHEIQWNFCFRFWLFAFHEENEHNLENANNFSGFRICMRSITKKP